MIDMLYQLARQFRNAGSVKERKLLHQPFCKTFNDRYCKLLKNQWGVEHKKWEHPMDRHTRRALHFYAYCVKMVQEINLPDIEKWFRYCLVVSEIHFQQHQHFEQNIFLWWGILSFKQFLNAQNSHFRATTNSDSVM